MTLFAPCALLPDGWARDVVVEMSHDGSIANVATSVIAPPAGAERVDGALVPGVPNLHSHAFQRAMAGRAERRAHARDNFWTWRDAMYRLAADLDPDRLYAIARSAYVAMLSAGYTSVAEFHYLHRDASGAWYRDRAAMSHALVTAARDAGIAICLLPVLYAHGDVGGVPLDAARKRFATDVDDVLTLAADLRRAYAHDGDVVVGACAHSLRAVTPEELTALVAASPRDVPMHLHVAEQRREVEAVRAWLGAPPVAWLLANNDVDARWCLVHATHLEEAERRALAHSGAVAGLCPTTEANLGDGFFPLGAYLDDGGSFGIGSDGNTSISVVEELRWLEYGQRLVEGRRLVAARADGGSCGESLYRFALAGGARAVGRNAGSIAAGARADFAVLPLDEGDDAEAVLDRYVFATDRARPSAVYVSGRPC